MYHKTNQKDAIKEFLQSNVYGQFEDKLKQRVIAKERINCAVKEIRLGNTNTQYIYNVLIGYPKDFDSHSTSVLYYCDRDLNTLENLFIKKAYKSVIDKSILVFQILRRYNIRIDHEGFINKIKPRDHIICRELFEELGWKFTCLYCFCMKDTSKGYVRKIKNDQFKKCLNKYKIEDSLQTQLLSDYDQLKE